MLDSCDREEWCLPVSSYLPVIQSVASPQPSLSPQTHPLLAISACIWAIHSSCSLLITFSLSLSYSLFVPPPLVSRRGQEERTAKSTVWDIGLGASTRQKYMLWCGLQVPVFSHFSPDMSDPFVVFYLFNISVMTKRTLSHLIFPGNLVHLQTEYVVHALNNILLPSLWLSMLRYSSTFFLKLRDGDGFHCRPWRWPDC